ncbi:MAG: cobaltochelatase subunit CobN [Hyphomicrobiaceae bacterium]
MHLLVAQSGTIDDGDEPRDLAQSPGDIVVLSAADTELSLLSTAQARRRNRPDRRSLRLANLLHLKHNYSVDLYIEKTLSHAKLVIVRLLGGISYWPYGLERLSALAKRGTFQLAVMPGDDKSDRQLLEYSTLSTSDVARLWSYLREGGLDNAERFLEAADVHLSGGAMPLPARPLLKAGIHRQANRFQANPRPTAAIIFYRALFESGDLLAVEQLFDELEKERFAPVSIFVASLRDPFCSDFVNGLLTDWQPDVILNMTAFSSSQPDNRDGGPLGSFGVPVLQVVAASESEENWWQGSRGLSARDIAMHVALPEVDGRLLTRAISFKSDAKFDKETEHYVVHAQPTQNRTRFVARQAGALSKLKHKPAAQRKIAIILANYPNRDARIANGVGLDTPASTIAVLNALQGAGYYLDAVPKRGNDLIAQLKAGPTSADNRNSARHAIACKVYNEAFNRLPERVRKAVENQWGPAEKDPSINTDGHPIAAVVFGNTVVGIQPARGYNIDPKATYHDPALVPPHSYCAFYFWLRDIVGVDAIIHLGKHGNLEWLPGKALALSEECFPEVILGPTPNIYPFIVNDPGEGSQAKRRTSAVIVDHLMPPMTRAEVYGPLRELERLVDEYYEAAGMDEPRRKHLEREILNASDRLGFGSDIGLSLDGDAQVALEAVDSHLCDLKEMQIRDGLHTLGQSPKGRERVDTLIALARIPRNAGSEADESLHRALARDLGLDNFDPLDTNFSSSWTGHRPAALQAVSDDPWRSAGDTLERIELLAAEMVAGDFKPRPEWRETHAVLGWLHSEMANALDRAGGAEISGILKGLNGRFVEPGPAGAPTRGRPDVLPTGRNFFSLDSRVLPTRAAWELGRKSADRVVERHCQDHGDWPKAIALSAWGTANMRTGGDDIAQALALMGVRPAWEPTSGRVIGFEIIPLAKLARPRVDVTFRVSGFFRDAFPAQMDLIDSAVRAVSELDESEDQNPLAAAVRRDREKFCAEGLDTRLAELWAAARVFGSQPGAYGAGLQALIDEKIWDDHHDLAEAFLRWGEFGYGGKLSGEANRAAFKIRIGEIDAILHNQDNREHDILDSDDYYQFAGGLAVAARAARGSPIPVYLNDHSRPERPIVRPLQEEIGRVVRGRAANPKWIAGVMRHGYKGAFEIAATVDYLFAFAATTDAVRDHHFDSLYDAYVADDTVREFLAENNPDALREIADRFEEAILRDLWAPRRNSVREVLQRTASRSAKDQ